MQRFISQVYPNNNCLVRKIVQTNFFFCKGFWFSHPWLTEIKTASIGVTDWAKNMLWTQTRTLKDRGFQGERWETNQSFPPPTETYRYLVNKEIIGSFLELPKCVIQPKFSLPSWGPVTDWYVGIIPPLKVHPRYRGPLVNWTRSLPNCTAAQLPLYTGLSFRPIENPHVHAILGQVHILFLICVNISFLLFMTHLKVFSSQKPCIV